MSFAPKQVGKVLTFANAPAGGVLGTGLALETARIISVTQTTVGQTMTLVPPVDTTALMTVRIANTGTAAFTLYGVSMTPGNTAMFMWSGTAWLAPVQSAGTAVAQTGVAYASGNLTPTGTTAASALTYMSVNLPVAGTYLLTYGVRVATGAASVTGLNGGLFTGANATVGGATGGTLVPNSEIIAGTSFAASSQIMATGTGSILVTVAGPTTYVCGLWAFNATGAVAQADNNGRSFITYVQITGAPVSFSIVQTGTAYSPGTVVITGTTAATALTAMSITLPSAGTYQISYTVRGNNTGAGAAGVVAGLFTTANTTFTGATGGTLVANSEVKAIYFAGTLGIQASVTGSIIVSVLAATTYVVGVWGDGGTTVTAQSDSNGRSSVTYVQLATAATTVMSGATATLAGTAGFVPGPPVAYTGTVFRGSGAFGVEEPPYSATEPLQPGAVRWFAGATPGTPALNARGTWRYIGPAGVPAVGPALGTATSLAAWEPLSAGCVFSANCGVAQSIPTAVVTVVDFVSIASATVTLGEFLWDATNKGFVVPYKGVYALSGFTAFAGNATGVRVLQMGIATTGAIGTTFAYDQRSSAGPSTSTCQVMTTASLTPGQVIGLFVTQNSGVAIPLFGTAPLMTMFSATLLRLT